MLLTTKGKGAVIINKKCIALEEQQYRKIIELIRSGFILDGRKVKPNIRIATILMLEATLGLRLGDVLSLRMDSFIKDGKRWRLDIIEAKTGKAREFTVPDGVYAFIQNYAYEQNIGKKAKLFNISARQVERFLEGVCYVLGYQKVSTHSFRKYFASCIYLNSNYNLILVQKLLQHSSVEVTRRYIGIASKEIEEALQNHTGLI